MAGRGGASRGAGSVGRGKSRPGKPANQTRTQAKLKPQGAKDGCKRTPHNAYDAYKNRQSYNAEEVVHKRLFKGKPEYFVKWVDIGTDGNTWEPPDNLVGTDGQDAIKSYEDKQRVLVEQVRVPLTAFPLIAC